MSKTALAPPATNELLRLLPHAARRRLMASSTYVALRLADVLSEPGEPSRFVYFPVSGFISLVKEVNGSPGLEVGMVGREGLLGVHVALGVVTAPLRAVVQGAGIAVRMESATFRAELIASPALKRWVDRYVYVLMAQLATSAGCVRFHEIGPRLARWLLMSQDRADSDNFAVTHEFLAYMLGVRRVGVTTAAVALHRQGLISYQRGDMTVTDRAGLEKAACSCYAMDGLAYREALS